SVAPSDLADGGSPQNARLAVGAIDESELLSRALDVVAGAGDPEPVLIQHARGTRFEVTRTTGSMVFSDAPSYIVVTEGDFQARVPRTARHGPPGDEVVVAYRFRVLVFDIETGQITDCGLSNERPDLASLGDVVTDYDARG